MISLKFFLAFCSLSYELLLAQGLSMFLDNTVLRYSTTIGLYMFTMGLGALASAKSDSIRPAQSLWQVEILLTLSGMAGVTSLFLFSGLNMPVGMMVVWAYMLVAWIGFLTGLELPLMLMMSSGTGKPSRENLIAADYAGACVAAVLFVIYFYPLAGIFQSVMVIAGVNALAAVYISIRWHAGFSAYAKECSFASVSLVGGALALWVSSGFIEAQLLKVYTG